MMSLNRTLPYVTLDHSQPWMPPAPVDADRQPTGQAGVCTYAGTGALFPPLCGILITQLFVKLMLAETPHATSVLIVKPSQARTKPINFDYDLCAMHVHTLSAVWGDLK